MLFFSKLISVGVIVDWVMHEGPESGSKAKCYVSISRLFFRYDVANNLK